LTQLWPDKVLATVTARDRKIRRVVERTIRPERYQIRVLVVWMRCDVKHASEHAQLLQCELDPGDVHRRRHRGRRRLQRNSGAANRNHDRDNLELSHPLQMHPRTVSMRERCASD